MTLNSFLLSTTEFPDIGWEGVETADDLREKGVFLKDTPVLAILEAALR